MSTVTSTDAPRGRSRDADGTRQRLLDAARLRFARDGYSATTVRDIAADAGVNVALINRYFSSKEGLFEACLRSTVENLEKPVDATVERLADSMLAKIAGTGPQAHPLEMLLLLRSSGDERADRIRRDTLRGYSESIASVAGWRPGDDEAAVLRAQLALATGLGVALLRSSTALEPLASASADDLRAPMVELLEALLAGETS